MYQQQGESVREYVASLRQLARKCKFGEMEEEMVRDQLIERTNNVKVREKLLMESGTLSLANIVELACQVEIAVEEVRQMMSDREMTDKPQSASVLQRFKM